MSTGFDTYPEFEDAVALGLVEGYELTSRWHEDNATSTTQSEMTNSTDAIRTLPTTATVITIASSSAEDDPDDGVDAGTGVHTVHIYYLDENWLEQVEIVDLNGTANVTTTGTAIRFLAAHAEVVGSTGAAVGDISFTVDGNVQSRILAGQSETREAAFHCPDDKYILIRSAEMFTGRSSNVDVDFAIEIRHGPTDVWHTVFSGDVYQQAVDFTDFRFLLGPRDDLRVLVTASGTGPAAGCRIHGWKIVANQLKSQGSRYALYGNPKVAR